jgi:hypothetical protein
MEGDIYNYSKFNGDFKSYINFEWTQKDIGVTCIITSLTKILQSSMCLKMIIGSCLTSSTGLCKKVTVVSTSLYIALGL